MLAGAGKSLIDRSNGCTFVIGSVQQRPITIHWECRIKGREQWPVHFLRTPWQVSTVRTGAGILPFAPGPSSEAFRKVGCPLCPPSSPLVRQEKPGRSDKMKRACPGNCFTAQPLIAFALGPLEASPVGVHRVLVPLRFVGPAPSDAGVAARKRRSSIPRPRTVPTGEPRDNPCRPRLPRSRPDCRSGSDFLRSITLSTNVSVSAL